jgi:hypothetical protein
LHSGSQTRHQTPSRRHRRPSAACGTLDWSAERSVREPRSWRTRDVPVPGVPREATSTTSFASIAAGHRRRPRHRCPARRQQRYLPIPHPPRCLWGPETTRGSGKREGASWVSSRCLPHFRAPRQCQQTPTTNSQHGRVP